MGTMCQERRQSRCSSSSRRGERPKTDRFERLTREPCRYANQTAFDQQRVAGQGNQALLSCLLSISNSEDRVFFERAFMCLVRVCLALVVYEIVRDVRFALRCDEAHVPLADLHSGELAIQAPMLTCASLDHEYERLKRHPRRSSPLPLRW
jgi:hypothetical protein